MLKSTKSTIKRKFNVRYLQKEFHFFISVLHQDKSHTPKFTAVSLEKMKIDQSLECIPFQPIPSKSADVSPMDFCAFGLLKRALSKRKPTTIDELWKVEEEELMSKLLEI